MYIPIFDLNLFFPKTPWNPMLFLQIRVGNYKWRGNSFITALKSGRARAPCPHLCHDPCKLNDSERYKSDTPEHYMIAQSK